MFAKKITFIGLVLSVFLLVSACSNNEKSEEPESTNASTSEVLVLSGDTVSEQGGCVLASRYTVGDKIVFRMNATDAGTNKQAVDAKLQVHLSTGEVLDMVYGEHGDDKFWVIAYPVTADTPTGSMDYYVTAEDGNKKGEFRPFNVQPSLLSIVDPDTAAAPETAEPEKKVETVDLSNVTTNQNVDIVAKNFVFKGKNDEDTFYVKAGEEVTLSLTSEEGMHGITVEGLDVAIKEPNGTVKFTPKEAGEYQIVCSIFCGAGHGDMTSTLVVVK